MKYCKDARKEGGARCVSLARSEGIEGDENVETETDMFIRCSLVRVSPPTRQRSCHKSKTPGCQPIEGNCPQNQRVVRSAPFSVVKV